MLFQLFVCLSVQEAPDSFHLLHLSLFTRAHGYMVSYKIYRPDNFLDFCFFLSLLGWKVVALLFYELGYPSKLSTLKLS